MAEYIAKKQLLEKISSGYSAFSVLLSSLSETQLTTPGVNDGWSVKDHGHISYLPLGDQDAFNWQHIAIAAWPKIVEILKQKEKSRELIGLVMTWKDANIGGEFLFFPDGQLLAVSWSVNRKALKHLWPARSTLYSRSHLRRLGKLLLERLGLSPRSTHSPRTLLQSFRFDYPHRRAYQR